MRLPDFLIIGAMKSATSTLHDQLSYQSGIFMSDPKEIYFFSDDDVYENGMDWYTKHFLAAAEHDICGESSTHYTKLPTYPDTCKRLKEHLPSIKVIYVMRHPVDRLVSQYIHHWSEKEASGSLSEAIATMPILKSYSDYVEQLNPYIELYGKENILPVFFDSLRSNSQHELERIAQFLGYEGKVKWIEDVGNKNVSSARMRKNPFRDWLVGLPVFSTIRKKFIPQSARDYVKRKFQMTERPQLTLQEKKMLEREFNPMLSELSGWFGLELNCENFKSVTQTAQIEWK